MWETEATKPADLTAPHRFPSMAGKKHARKSQTPRMGWAQRRDKRRKWRTHSWHEATCEHLWWALLCGVLFFKLFALLNLIKLFPELGLPSLPRPRLPVSWLPVLSQACWVAGAGLYNTARSSPPPQLPAPRRPFQKSQCMKEISVQRKSWGCSQPGDSTLYTCWDTPLQTGILAYLPTLQQLRHLTILDLVNHSPSPALIMAPRHLLVPLTFPALSR